MDDKTKLEILQYWTDNLRNIMKIPPQLEGKITKEEVKTLYLEVGASQDKQRKSSEFFQHAEKIRKKIKDELETNSIKLHDEVINKQAQLQAELNKKYDKSNTIMSKQNLIMALQIIATLALIYFTVSIGNQSNSIAEAQNNIAATQINISQKLINISLTQTEILRVSNPPYEPFIEIVADFEDLDIPAWKLVDKRSPGYPADQRWGNVDLTIYNFGKMDSQYIYCYPYTTKGEFFAYLDEDNFRNIPSGTSNRTRLHIAYQDCVHDNNECENEDLVPTGNHNLTLQCECRGCKTQREFYPVINFCVYNRNKTNECPEYVTNK
ncbi:MAG: hypothetical protein ABIJ40_20905 [Bacteroidota bacterium]